MPLVPDLAASAATCTAEWVPGTLFLFSYITHFQIWVLCRYVQLIGTKSQAYILAAKESWNVFIFDFTLRRQNSKLELEI